MATCRSGAARVEVTVAVALLLASAVPALFRSTIWLVESVVTESCIWPSPRAPAGSVKAYWRARDWLPQSLRPSLLLDGARPPR